MAEAIERALPLEGQYAAGANVTVRPASPARRISLRVAADNVAAVSKGLGVDLPTRPKQSNTAGERSVLWLGPDEWLVIEGGDRDPMADLDRSKASYGAVDVSHRNTGIIVGGAMAADVINAGCPQDLSLEAFPVGACSRTLLGKVEIVLFRTAEDAFRVECWRSFSEYAFAFLKEAAHAA